MLGAEMGRGYVCGKPRYALYSVNGGEGQYRRYYYRCIGSQSFRNFPGPLCQNRAVRQEYLDDTIWSEIVRLLQNPALIQQEIDRRMQEAKNAIHTADTPASLAREWDGEFAGWRTVCSFAIALEREQRSPP
jgi:site-specific DNA recombinase